MASADDEGVGLAIGLVVVIAKDLLEPLRPDQIGERGNYFTLLQQDGSSQAQMFALLTKRGGGKWALRRLGPFIEQIGVGTKLEIGSPHPAGSSGLRSDQLRCLEGALKERMVSFPAGHELYFVLASFQSFGNRRTQVTWLRVKRPGLKPSQESLNGCVAHLAR